MSLPFSPKLRLAPVWPAVAAIAVAAGTTIALLPEPLVEEAARDLEHTLELVEGVLPPPVARLEGPDAELQREILSVSRNSGYRISVISPRGVVLADTAVAFERLGSLENHRGRPEVVAALERGSGYAHRHSATTKEVTAYAAKLLSGSDGTTWVVRLARPIRSLGAIRSRLMRIELAAAAAAALVAWFVSLWFSRSLFRPLSRLIATADGLASGGPLEPIDVPENAELATLGRALDRLAREKDHQIALLAAERDHLRATVSGMGEGVLVVDERSVPEILNPAFCEMFGLDREVPAEEALDLAREPRLTELVTGVLRSGQPASLVLERFEPSPHPLALLASPLAGGVGAVVVARDLSESERLHQIRRDFVANVSHELRTPLAAIQAYAETLVDGAIDDRATALRFSERILAQCRRLGELLDDLLTLSRLESTEPSGTLETVSLAALAEEAIELIKPRADAKQVQLALVADSPVEVIGDSEGLLRLLSNLLDNAVKYNQTGGRVEIRIDYRDDSVRLEVEDSGIGIAVDHQPRLFERFYRVDSGRARDEGGTGLGLAIVKHVAQAHGGRVEVESEPGRGSTFRVVLPTRRQ